MKKQIECDEAKNILEQKLSRNSDGVNQDVLVRLFSERFSDFYQTNKRTFEEDSGISNKIDFGC